MTVMNLGVAEVANLTIGSGTAFGWLAIGTGNGFTAASTTLNVETDREAATTSRVTTDVTSDTSQFVKQFTFTGAVAVTECGVLNAASAGVLLCAQDFSAVNVTASDTLTITYKIDYD